MSRGRAGRAAVLMTLIAGAVGVARAGAWEEHRLGPAGSVLVLEVELYRGIVRFEAAGPAEPARVRAGLVPFDGHRPGEPIEASIRAIPRGALELSTESGVTRIAAPGLRDLVVIDLKAPATAAVVVRVAHYGELTIDGAQGELELDLFQGSVDLRDIRGPALVHIVRDGSIHARLVPPVAARAMAFTTYEGDIDLELPGDLAGRLRIASARGVIRNEFPAPAEDRPPPGEPSILIRNAKGTIHVHPLP